MMFNVEEAGERIAGWLIADNPAAPPTLTIALRGGRERQRYVARGLRPDIRASGLHQTGECGFILDGSVIPGLTEATEIEIFDEASNTLLFRRAHAADAEIRLFHLETQTLPVYPVARHLCRSVQMIYADAEMISDETLSNVMRLHWPSVLISGALLLRNYETGLHAQDYRRAIMLCDPRRELAARLLRLRSLAADDNSRAGWRRLGQGALIELFAEVDITDAGALGRVFRRLDDELFFALASPMTRKLVAKTQDAPLEKQHIGLALDSLASFDVVGFDDELDMFVDGLEALLGEEELPRARIPDPPELAGILAALADCRPAEELLALDDGLYNLARAAFEKARSGEL